MPVAVGRRTSIVVNFTWPPRRGCAYAVVDVVSWSVSLAPRAAENTTVSSGIVVVWRLLSSSTLIGVIWLPRTRPVAGAGVTPPAMLPSTAVGAPATGSAGANVVGTNARSPAPCALIAGPDVGGYVSATSSAPFWSTVANAGPSFAD